MGFAVAVLCLLAQGCKKSENRGAGEKPPPTTPPARFVPAPVDEVELSRLDDLSDSRFQADIAEELARFSPARDGSRTEQFSEAATGRLKELAKVLADLSALEDALTRENLVAGETFRATTLHGGEELKLAFQSGGITVRRRVARPDRQTPEFAFRGVAGFATALKAMAGGADGLEAHFKIVGVSALGDGGFATRVLVHTAGTQDGSRHQFNATWRARWAAGDPNPPRLVEIELLDSEKVTARREAGHSFADCTESVLAGTGEAREQISRGVDHWRARIDWRFGIELLGPHGLAVGDVDGDGLDDVFLCAPGGLPNRLFFQQADGTVRDGAREWGVDYVESTSSALLIDLDNDGDQDLAFCSGRYLMVFENTGESFRKAVQRSSDSIARSMSAADFDLDGDLDLFVCGYSSRSGDSIGIGRPMPYHDANNGVRNYLLANRGGWKFEDVTGESGLDQNNRRFSYAAVWEDFDDDGDPDLYVANDFGRNNLYRNDRTAGGATFTDIAASAGVEDISAGMSVSWGDYDRDGAFDVYVGNMFSSAGNRVAYQRNFRTGSPDAIKGQFQRHARGNTLFRNAGQGRFEDVTMKAGVNMGRWAWSSNFADINNDGWPDLLVANGMITGAADPGDL